MNFIRWIKKLFLGSPKPTKRKPIPPSIRNAVWEQYHGQKSLGMCYCCGKSIQRLNRGWHCSHVKADVKGGDVTIDNLRTCCSTCNLSMGDQNLYTYIRDKNMAGPGAKNCRAYLQKHKSQRNDKRTNNWRKNK